MIRKFNPDKVKFLRLIDNVLSICYHEKKAKCQPNISDANRILIIDPTLIGDIVMLTPFLRIIHKNNEHCKITLVCGSWAKAILETQNLVDEFIIIDSSFLNSVKKLALSRRKLKRIVLSVNVHEYDYALEPRGDIRYIYFMHYCSARRKISYSYTGGECFLTDVIEPSDNVTHLVEDKLYFLEKLGCKYDKDNDIFPYLDLNNEQVGQKNAFIRDNQFMGDLLIGIHPGASLDKKQWDYYDKLLMLLNSAIDNVAFVIFKGPGEDTAVDKVEKAAKKCDAKYIISNTSIQDYMVRISACNMMVCNDSGAGHIAAAYGITTFVMFGPFFPEMVKPYVKKNGFCFSEKIDCKPCLSRICDGDKKCLNRIEPEAVKNKILDYIDTIKIKSDD